MARCDKCKSREAHVGYSSMDSRTGVATEWKLCMDCAAECIPEILGMFSEALPMELAAALMGAQLPAAPPVTYGRRETDCSCPRCRGMRDKPRKPIMKVDPEFDRRRKLNAKLQKAIDCEDYEEAAKIRDMIGEMENI